MSTAPLHLLSVEDGIAQVTLNRPAALNSINRALRLELLELFPALDLRKDVKVIVITGAGAKAFCTGADLKERSTRTTEEMVYDRQHAFGRMEGTARRLRAQGTQIVDMLDVSSRS